MTNQRSSPRITIDTTGISDEQKKTEKFQSAYRDMYKQLSAPGFIPVLCAHEAAHALYFAVLGVKTFEPCSAKIWFEPAINDYKGSLATVQPVDVPLWTPGNFWDWLLKIACAYAAGGVVVREKMPASDGGDQDDKERFEALCETLNENDPNMHIDWEEWWERAQKAVAQMLDDDPERMTIIDNEAENFRPQLGF
jgi:hypothetical protein